MLRDCQADRGHVWPRDLPACCGMAGRWDFTGLPASFSLSIRLIDFFLDGVSDLGKCHYALVAIPEH